MSSDSIKAVVTRLLQKILAYHRVRTLLGEVEEGYSQRPFPQYRSLVQWALLSPELDRCSEIFEYAMAKAGRQGTVEGSFFRADTSTKTFLGSAEDIHDCMFEEVFRVISRDQAMPISEVVLRFVFVSVLASYCLPLRWKDLTSHEREFLREVRGILQEGGPEIAMLPMADESSALPEDPLDPRSRFVVAMLLRGKGMMPHWWNKWASLSFPVAPWSVGGIIFEA